MSSKDFKTAFVPQVGSEKDSDDSESTTNSTGAISYNPLKDADAESERSSLNIPIHGSLQSLPSYLSESSQNLLGDVDDEDDNDGDEDKKDGQDNGEDTDSNLDIISTKDLSDSEDTSSSLSATIVTLKAPPDPQKDLVETESIQNSSGSFANILSQSEVLKAKESPQVSVSSEADLMRFDIDVGSRLVADAQSIDSHTFTMLDKDRSLNTLNSDDVVESLEDEAGEEGLHVRFEGKLT